MHRVFLIEHRGSMGYRALLIDDRALLSRYRALLIQYRALLFDNGARSMEYTALLTNIDRAMLRTELGFDRI